MAVYFCPLACLLFEAPLHPPPPNESPCRFQLALISATLVALDLFLAETQDTPILSLTSPQKKQLPLPF